MEASKITRKIFSVIVKSATIFSLDGVEYWIESSKRYFIAWKKHKNRGLRDRVLGPQQFQKIRKSILEHYYHFISLNNLYNFKT